MKSDEMSDQADGHLGMSIESSQRDQITALSFKKHPTDGSPPLKMGDNFKAKNLRKMSNYDQDQLTSEQNRMQSTPMLRNDDSKITFIN
jgi:hypothetical protein